MFSWLSTAWSYIPTVMTYSKYLAITVSVGTWIRMSFMDRRDVKQCMHQKGAKLSQKFQGYGVWDRFVEPWCIREFAVLFSAGNSFLKGMISDNVNQEEVQEGMEEMYSEVEGEIGGF